MSSGELDGKVAVVTGASRGIGTAIAERFAAAGAAVAVVARSTDASNAPFPGTIHETVDAIRASGGTAIAIAADLSHPDDRERLIATAEADLGGIDILVNNAAVTYFLPVADFTPKRYDLMFEVQVRAPFQMSQMVLAGMQRKGAGWILNISSGAARHPQIPPDASRGLGGTVYGMCKAALERFSSGLAAEMYASNIAVNALSPNHVVPTPGTVFHNLVRPDDPTQVAEPPEVMAEASLLLCSLEPTALTGRIAYSQDLLDEFGRTAPVAGV